MPQEQAKTWNARRRGPKMEEIGMRPRQVRRILDRSVQVFSLPRAPCTLEVKKTGDPRSKSQKPLDACFAFWKTLRLRVPSKPRPSDKTGGMQCD
jgi:hypothetical protein